MSFDDVVLPHLHAAHRLARWLTANDHDAEDAVQEASLRALLYFRTFSGGDARAWFLRIVRNACLRRLSTGRRAPTESFDELQHSGARSAPDPETLAVRSDEVRLIRHAMEQVPSRFRELLVLRELQGLSYRELADVMDIPIGTVMSSLSRGRRAFRGALQERRQRDGAGRNARKKGAVNVAATGAGGDRD